MRDQTGIVCYTGIMLAFFLLISINVQAQDSDYDDFRDRFKSEYFSVGVLLQTVGTYQYQRPVGTGNNGYSIGNARAQIFGEIDNTFGYQLQANFRKNPAVLDANMYYKFTPQMSVKAGLFKSPFSGEFLMNAAALDFVNRSTVVNQLAPSRQIGLQLGGGLSKNRFRYKVGVFNGNGYGNNSNNDGNFLYVSRMESHVSTDEAAENKVVVGINASYEQKDQAASAGNLRSTFEGEQALLGSDIRLTHNNLLLSGEFIYSWLQSDFGTESNPFGYQTTAGYFVLPKMQLLVRWDRFDNDDMIIASASEDLGAGLNFYPNSFSKIQLNYLLPTDWEAEFSQVLVNLQISL